MDLQEIGDRLEVIDVITRYTRAIDTRRWDDLHVDVFTPDAVLDYSSVGGPVAPPSEAVPWVAQGLNGFDRYQHIIGQVSIGFADLGSTGRPDEAHVTAYFTNPMVAVAPDGAERLLEVGGYYHHTMVRTPDGWRSRHLVDENLWMRGF
ncbi:nuclear transport factor 2 family protein [Nocardioides alcanivorans]|uniref:nuclear transport factor 2 family protein n=1 Tax=Nocardioides alcanivorans TaxID=2897352 RepID=UPI001F361590|nr:nuclear transport factor 2 family protein [Nocardioides alcanivorans]